MKEQSLMMKPPCVQAILNRTKTQTRRLYKATHASCPYGMVGATIWVRESWIPIDREKHKSIYAADFPEERRADIALKRSPTGHWNTAMFMPRWASRLTLQIVRVSTEYVRMISSVDARREGFESKAHFKSAWDEIHGPESWLNNDRVWVLTFVVVSK